MLVKRELTDQEVNYNNNRLKQLTFKDLIYSDNLIDLYDKLNLYISVDEDGWTIQNNKITVDDSFLKKHYKNVNTLKNKACIYTYKKLNIKCSIYEYKKEVKKQFNKYYIKYFNFLVGKYQRHFGITDDNISFLTVFYEYVK